MESSGWLRSYQATSPVEDVAHGRYLSRRQKSRRGLSASWAASRSRFVQGDRASILGQQPATIYPVAGADLGRMVSRAHELDEALGYTLTIHGQAA